MGTTTAVQRNKYERTKERKKERSRSLDAMDLRLRMPSSGAAGSDSSISVLDSHIIDSVAHAHRKQDYSERGSPTIRILSSAND